MGLEVPSPWLSFLSENYSLNFWAGSPFSWLSFLSGDFFFFSFPGLEVPSSCLSFLSRDLSLIPWAGSTFLLALSEAPLFSLLSVFYQLLLLPWGLLCHLESLFSHPG